MKLIERHHYLNRLKSLRLTPDIKIITGIRRCGKSELMRQYMTYVRDEDKTANIIFIDYFDLDFENLKDYRELNDYVKRRRKDGVHNYLFIDEVQLCPNFQLTLNSLHNSRDYDIYITGSNTFLLSSDLTTLFTGRFIELRVFPFSFREFNEYFSDENDLHKQFDDYVRMGGLPGSYVYSNNEDRLLYLNEVYHTIVNRDLVSKYAISDTSVLDHLSEFMMDIISNQTSPNRVANSLSANFIETNHVTIGKYIQYLCNAFMFYKVKRYDIKGKKYLETADKYYLADLGLRFAKLGNRNLDYGRCYENIVAIELMRRGYEVYVGKLYQKVIDFIAIKGDEKIYYQVSDDISSADTFEREVTSLLSIKDANPKILLARTNHPEYQYEGIKIIDLALWLNNPD